ncbi:MAG: leucine-rich repeat domain-containing protein [Microcoleus sp. SM1_3_4]|nr:leucine-rich repeat domain-containing protein [Microcoleus sp. SM1_3_4]
MSLIFMLGSDVWLGAQGQQTPTANYKTFTDWCVNKDKLNPEVRRTVDAFALLGEAGTNECEAASQKLASLGELDLSFNQISDITPVASLTKLTAIYLAGNPIAHKTCPLKPESICKF